MSTLWYYRLALLQWIRYNQSLEEVVSLQSEIAELHAKVSAHQKKHRRCDKEIEKHEQVTRCLASVLIAIRSTARKLP